MMMMMINAAQSSETEWIIMYLYAYSLVHLLLVACLFSQLPNPEHSISVTYLLSETVYMRISI